MAIATVLWQWLDRPGHEAARLVETSLGQRLEGSAVFLDEGSPCRLEYRVECDPGWQTIGAEVHGSVDERTVDVTVSRDSGGRWLMNGAAQPEVDGCFDVDLNFSPSTNLLPIRRLALQPGEGATVRAAWLRFPSFELQVLEQRYVRLSANEYRYQSGSFSADLLVDEHGLVREYGGVWRALA